MLVRMAPSVVTQDYAALRKVDGSAYLYQRHVRELAEDEGGVWSGWLYVRNWGPGVAVSVSFLWEPCTDPLLEVLWDPPFLDEAWEMGPEKVLHFWIGVEAFERYRPPQEELDRHEQGLERHLGTLEIRALDREYTEHIGRYSILVTFGINENFLPLRLVSDRGRPPWISRALERRRDEIDALYRTTGGVDLNRPWNGPGTWMGRDRDKRSEDRRTDLAPVEIRKIMDAPSSISGEN